VKRHLNTLYVTSQGAYLSKDGANVVVAIDGAERARVPIHTLGGLVGFGRVTLTPPLLGFCAEAGVAVTFLSEHGKFLARVGGPVSGTCCCGASSTAVATTRTAAPRSSGAWSSARRSTSAP
jgi:CRISPR-associated protein Cas1